MIRYFRTQLRRLFVDDTPLIRLFRNAGWLFGGDAVTMGIGVVQGILIARSLGVEMFGALSLITTYTLFVNQLIDSRVWETVIKYVSQFRTTGDEERVTAVIKLSYLIDLSTGSLAFLLVLATSSLAASLFIKDVSLAPLIRLFSLSVLVAIPQDTSTALLRVNNRFRWLAFQNTFEAVVRFVGVIAVLLLDGGVISLLIVYLITGAISTIILLLMVFRIRWEIGLVNLRHASIRILRPQGREIGKFLLATNGNALLKMLRNADVLLLGLLLNPTQVGYYRVARSLTNLMNMPVNPIYTTSYPEFANLWHEGKLFDLKTFVLKILATTTMIAVIGGLVMFFLGEWIIRLSVGTEYLPALSVLRWLAVGTAVAVATSILRPLLLAAGQATPLITASILGLFLQLILFLTLIPVMGLDAAGVAYLGFYSIWVFVCTWAIRQKWKEQTLALAVGN